MRVGLVSPYDFGFPGGVNQHVRSLGRALRAAGHEVEVLAPATRPVDLGGVAFRRIGGSVPVPANDSVARVSLSFHLARGVAGLVQASRFDVLHFHEPLLPDLTLSLLRMSRCANVGTFHASARRHRPLHYASPFLARYLRRLDATVAVSETARRFVRRYFPDCDPAVIPNGIDLDRFHPRVPPLPALRDGAFNVLFVGRLEKRKGVGDLIEALRLVDIPRTRLLVVGDGPLRLSLERAATGLGGRVLFAGRVADAELPRWYASADAFCSPATGRESFGLVLLEAMACGVPVVASRIPGYSDVVGRGQAAVLVQPRRPPALAAALRALAADVELRSSMREAGVRLAEGHAWPRVAEAVLDVYGKALRARARTRAPRPSLAG